MNTRPLHFRRIVAALVAAGAILTAMPVLPALAQDPVPGATATVNTGALNLRSGPGVTYGAIATLPYGFGVQLVARSSNNQWVLVRLTNGVQGWVGSGLIVANVRISDLPINDTAAASNIIPTATVSVSFVNVRQNADPESAILGTLSGGDVVQLLGRSFDAQWANVRIADGRVGWITATALDATVPIRSLNPSDGSVVGPYVPPFGYPGSPTGGTTGGNTVRRYTVQRGDTLGSIAARYGTTIGAIAQANGIVNPNNIFYGTVLIIP